MPVESDVKPAPLTHYSEDKVTDLGDSVMEVKIDVKCTFANNGWLLGFNGTYSTSRPYHSIKSITVC